MSTAEDHLKFLTSFVPEQSEVHTLPVEMPPELLGADTGIVPDMNRLAEVAERGAPAEIAMAVLEEVGLAPRSDLVDKYRLEAQELWIQSGGNIPPDQQEHFHATTQVIRYSDLLAQRVRNADTYQQWLWADYSSRTGQKVERVEELFDATEPYEESSLLKAFDTLNFRMRGDTRVQDAERIARILLRSEPHGSD